MYRRSDVLAILRIKELLYGHRFTIEGARRRLAAEEESLRPTAMETLRRVTHELREISESLRTPPR
jgi:hypothetical protein